MKEKMLLTLFVSMFLLIIAAFAALVFISDEPAKPVWAVKTEPAALEDIEVKKIRSEEMSYTLVTEYPVFPQAALTVQLEEMIQEKEAHFLRKVRETTSDRAAGSKADFALSLSVYEAGTNLFSIGITEKRYISPEEHGTTEEWWLADTEQEAVFMPDELFINPDIAAAALQLPLDQTSVFIRNNAFHAGDLRVSLFDARLFLKRDWRKRLPITPPPVRDSDKQIALTFDDGPHPVYTPAVLDVLKKHGVQATFFVLGAEVTKHPEIVKQAVLDGHEIGNHSFSHKSFVTMTEPDVKADIAKTAEAIEQAAGVSPELVRPPYGAVNKEVEQWIGTKPVLWTVDTEDWRTGDPKAIEQAVAAHVKDGAIVLLHDIYPETAAALDAVLTNVQKQGYTVVPVSQLKP